MLCHCQRAVFTLAKALRQASVHPGCAQGEGCAQGVAVSIAVWMANVRSSAVVSRPWVVPRLGHTCVTTLLWNVARSLVTSVRAHARQGFGVASVVCRSRCVRIGLWLEDCSQRSATWQLTTRGVSVADTRVRLIVLSRWQALHVMVPGGRVRFRSTAAATSSSLSAAACCVRHCRPPHVGWWRLKSPTTMWDASGVAWSWATSSSITGTSRAVLCWGDGL